MRTSTVAGVVGLVLASIVALPAAGASPRGGLAPSPASAADPIDDPLLRRQLAEGRTAGRPDRRGAIAVEVLLQPGAEATTRTLIDDLGGEVTGAAPGELLQAAVPAGRVDELALADGVGYVRAPRRVSLQPDGSHYLDAGATTAEVVGIANAAAWHAAGQTGAGVKIGIIDYFNQSKFTAAVAAGELVNPSGTFCVDTIPDGYDDCPAGSVFDPTEDGHGNAVAEIIHDLAPAAQLYLGRGSSISDMYAVVDWFAANGVRIVNRSLGSPYDGPGDGTGPLDSLVDYAATKGITWVNSAGNEGAEQYWRGSWVDADGDGWLEFGPGDESLGISTASSGGCLDILGFRWSDWGEPSTRTNYDVYVYEGDTPAFPPNGAPDQQAGAPPIELDGVSNYGGGFCSSLFQPNIRVRRTAAGSGTAGDVLELLLYSGALERWQSASSAGTGIVDSKNRAVLAVGAVDPAASGAIGSYSSQGPTNDGRRKPDLSASAGLSTTVFGVRGFAGTSAAAPSVTGVAALLLGANQAATPQGLAALLKHTVVDRGAAGPDSVFGTGEVRLGPPPSGSIDASPAGYTAVAPTRLLDTRSSVTLRGPLEPEQIIDLVVAGTAGIPANASAVALNLTIDRAAIGSYVQVLPTGLAPIDVSSNLNLEASGQTLANFTITPVGTGGSISIYAPAGGQVIVDLLGYYVPVEATSAGRTVPLTPFRVADTRQGGAAKPAPGSSLKVSFPAASGLPASGASAVILTVTGTLPTNAGFVTAYPTGGAVPNASLLNLTLGATNANSVIVPLGSDRTVSLFSSAGTHLIVDLAGYVTDAAAPLDTAGRFVAVRPSRISDSRAGAPFASGIGRTIQVGGAGGIPPTGAAAVSFNVTATQALGANGYLQLWPAGAAVGEFSNLNWSRAGQTIAGGGVVKLGTGGQLDVRTYQDAHVLVDVNGYFTG